jgi:Mg2+ and Co2+ transporter CorA
MRRRNERRWVGRKIKQETEDDWKRRRKEKEAKRFKNFEPPLLAGDDEPEIRRKWFPQVEMVSIFLLVQTPANTLITYADATTPRTPFDDLRDELRRAYSLPRSGDCYLLLYKILDALLECIDHPIDELKKRVKLYRKAMREGRRYSVASSHAHQAAVTDLLKGVKKFKSTVLSLPRVISHLKDHIRASSRNASIDRDRPNAEKSGDTDEQSRGGEHEIVFDHLGDLEDRLETEKFNLENLENECNGLQKELERAVDTETQNVLYWLTVLSGFFAPVRLSWSHRASSFDRFELEFCDSDAGELLSGHLRDEFRQYARAAPRVRVRNFLGGAALHVDAGWSRRVAAQQTAVNTLPERRSRIYERCIAVPLFRV